MHSLLGTVWHLINYKSNNDIACKVRWNGIDSETLLRGPIVCGGHVARRMLQLTQPQHLQALSILLFELN